MKFVDTYKKFVAPLAIPDITCIPLSALNGDNVVEKSENMPWYRGTSLLDFLETVHIANDHNLKDFRYPIQYVLRPNLNFRGFSGRIASGIVRKGDEVMAIPSGKKSHVKSIVTYDGELDEAFSPQSITITLEDEIDLSRGEMLVHPDNIPHISRNFEAMLVWMDEKPMQLDQQYFIKQTTNTTRVHIDQIKYKVDVNTMEQSMAETMSLNEIARRRVRLEQTVVFRLLQAKQKLRFLHTHRPDHQQYKRRGYDYRRSEQFRPILGRNRR